MLSAKLSTEEITDVVLKNLNKENTEKNKKNVLLN